MPTANDLKSVYSFISAFENTPTLAQYGDNSLPLYSVGLYLRIEDLGAFATEALTDDPQDKKADIIYIDEADRIACIAQGYSGRDWGKPGAPSNKAADLNTAMAWLLQTPIEDVPPAIRSHAKLLRDALDKKTIETIVVAYAHNAMESSSVDTELKTVRHLLKGLPITAGVEIEIVELGLRRTEALYLASVGVIQVTDQVEFESSEPIFPQVTAEWTAYTFALNGAALYKLYDYHGDELFSANLRDFLGLRRSPGNVNNRIKKTAEDTPANFYIVNNGITVVTKKADLDPFKRKLTLTGISIVNGAQTTGAIHAAGLQSAQNVHVLARVITVANEKLIVDIVAGNNTQNSIVAWDRRSNDPVQVRLASEFAAKGLQYVHRRSSARTPKRALFADSVGQALCAFGGDLQTAIRAKADIFELDPTYNKVFPPTIGIGHIFAVQTLSWAYDEFKGSLKTKAESGTSTAIETKQLRLLDYPASKQFLIYVIGFLREEIAGHRVPDASDFEVKGTSISTNAVGTIDAWVSAIRAIVPVLASNLPKDTDEYQVVRSTEQSEAVATAAKGVIAGVPVLQTAFEPLRQVLRGY